MSFTGDSRSPLRPYTGPSQAPGPEASVTYSDSSTQPSSTQPSDTPSRSRDRWSLETARKVYELAIEYRPNYSTPGGSPRQRLWEKVSERLKDDHHIIREWKQCSNFAAGQRKKWNDRQTLLKKSGWSADNEGKIVAPEGSWEAFLAVSIYSLA